MNRITDEQRKKLNKKFKSRKRKSLKFILSILVILVILIIGKFAISKLFGLKEKDNKGNSENQKIHTIEEKEKNKDKETLREKDSLKSGKSAKSDKTEKEETVKEQNRIIGNYDITNKGFVNKYDNSKIKNKEEALNIVKTIPENLQEMVKKYPEFLGTAILYDKFKNEDGSINIQDDYEATKYMDRKVKLPYFNQWDPRWGYRMVDDEFVAISGCGPTALTSIYVGLTGDTSYNPYKMVQKAYEYGVYYGEHGSENRLFIDFARDILGLHGEYITPNYETLKAQLDDGKIIVALVRENGIGDFTHGGHFIVISEYDENGNLTILDPNSYGNTNKKWDPERVFMQVKTLMSLSK